MMTVGIDNPAFEDFKDSSSDEENDSRVDENSNELNSARKNGDFKQASAVSEEIKTGLRRKIPI